MVYVPPQVDVDIVNSAFALIGEDPIESLDDETPGAQAAALLYQRVLDHLLGFYPWSFATRAFSLTRLADDPGDGWAFAFLLPEARIGPPLAISDIKDFRRPFTAYNLAEDHVHADVEKLWARLKFRAHPRVWSGPFTLAFTTGLAGELALSVTSDSKLRTQLRGEAFGSPQELGRGGLIKLAIDVDAQAQPSVVLASDGGPLIVAHGGGPWYEGT